MLDLSEPHNKARGQGRGGGRGRRKRRNKKTSHQTKTQLHIFKQLSKQLFAFETLNPQLFITAIDLGINQNSMFMFLPLLKLPKKEDLHVLHCWGILHPWEEVGNSLSSLRGKVGLISTHPFRTAQCFWVLESH